MAGRHGEYEEEEHGEDYHPVQPGDIFNFGRYVVCYKLGWGSCSTVWLAWDNRHSLAMVQRYVAMKVVRSAWEHMAAAALESSILSHADDQDPDGAGGVVRLIDRFIHRGPNGAHVCIVLEHLGDDLLTVLSRFGRPGLPLPAVKAICRHLLVALDFLHRLLGVTHSDIRPENVLLASPTIRPPAEEGLAGVDLRCKLADFGMARWVEEAEWGGTQTRGYKSPEVLLESGYSPAVDIWSLACVCFELATGVGLFDPCQGDGYDEDDDHLASMIEVLGEIPYYIINRGRNGRDFFNEYGKLRYISDLNPCPMDEMLQRFYGFSRQDADAMARFLLPMLSYDPADRPKPRELLRHPWLNASADAGGVEEEPVDIVGAGPSEAPADGAGEECPGDDGGGEDEGEEEFDVDDIILVLGSLGIPQRG